ncbi:MAG TPA: flagellar export protein FliJ [Dissulfurispiraceae bacterium]|nr:flagellar export protein FliJ [Dissulfurispiraceae bacterium]
MSTSIQSLLGLKRWKEDELKSLFALLTKELHAEEEKLNNLESRHAFMGVNIEGGGDELVDIAEIRLVQDYTEHLVLQIRRQQSVIADKQKQVDEARAFLLDAAKERKTFERLDEKQRQAAAQEQQRREQNDADERAVITYGRKKEKR